LGPGGRCGWKEAGRVRESALERNARKVGKTNALRTEAEGFGRPCADQREKSDLAVTKSD